ncbi:MAG: SpoIIE family protein phosphatase [Ignavibacteriales bacterium]|nr:SpoIIE family protein phosphatase [Ignavibacteriales bacterium]
MSARSIRLIYTTAAIIVLTVSMINFMQMMVYRVQGNDECAWRPRDPGKPGLLITDIIEGGVADQAGLHNGDILLKINGKDFRTANEAQNLIDELQPGEHATYLIERQGTQFEVSIAIRKRFDVFYLSIFLLGFGFLVVGYVVIMTKPQGMTQRLFGQYSILSMLVFALLIRRFDPSQNSFWEVHLLRIASVIAFILGPPIFLRFFFFFPVKKRIFDRTWVTASLYIVSSLLVAATLLSERLLIPIVVQRIIPSFLISSFMGGLIIFIITYFRQVDSSRKRQLRPILVGIGSGIIAFSYLVVSGIVNPFFFLYPARILPVLLIVSIPLAFGYSIFRYRLMDIDLIVKRSLIYATVTAAIAALYLLIVIGIGNLLAYFFGTEENRTLNIFAFVLIALVFDPVKRRTQTWIDRSFYRERLNYQRALLEFSQELPRQMNLEQILNSMVSRISGTMFVEKIAVVLCGEKEGCFCVTHNIPERYCQFIRNEDSLISLLIESRSPQSFALLAEEAESVEMNDVDKENILKSGVVLSVPMFLQEQLIGTINVGPKLSGKVYSQEDIDLLSTVASQAAIAIENARLHQSEIEKQKIEEELTLARRIQEGLLPKTDPLIDGLDIAGISIPALTVGGDYFDYIRLDSHKLLVVVADVSGKGMAASLYMSKVQGMVQLAAQMYTSPREILIHVNRMLYEGMERRSFITMILASFDLTRNEVRICRAGHHKAIFNNNGEMKYLEAKGIGLGLEQGPIFERELEEIRRPIDRGSMFVFYSDGLTEAMNDHKVEFGDGAIRAILTSVGPFSARDIQQSIINAVKEFQGSAEQHDDLTLVVVRTL